MRGGARGARLTGVMLPFHPHLAAAFERAGGRPLAQAATVSPEGLPEVRTVVLRRLGDDSAPSFASDARSAKFASLAAHPWLELCLWLPEDGVQLRLLGRAEIHRSDGHALALWEGLPPATQALFDSPPPGRPLSAATAPSRDPRGGPPAWFAAVRVPPQRFERLELGPPLRRRQWTDPAGGWLERDVVP